MSVVLDTSVLVAAMRSRRGAAYRVLSLVGTGRFEVVVSVPLILEYEETLRSQAGALGLTSDEIRDLLDYLCTAARRQTIFFLWRPQLRDPDDEMVLEAAVAGSCRHLVTFNLADFGDAARFGIRVVTPRDFLRAIGELP